MLSTRLANLLLLLAAPCVYAEGDAAENGEEKLSEAGQGDASFMLICSIVFVLLIFYLVNARNNYIRSCAWTLINLGTSIFIAVATYNVVDDLVEWMVSVEDHAPPTSENLMEAIILMVLWWIVLVLVLGFVSGSQLHLSGYGTVGGHIMGFAALDVFGKLCLMEGFNESAWMALVVILIAIVGMALLFATSKLFGMLMQKIGWVDDEDMDKWHDQCLDSGNDFFALCLGFLLTMWSRGLIIGYFPPVDGSLDGENVDKDATTWCYAAGILFLLFSIGAKYVLHGMHKAEKKKGAKQGSSMATKAFELLSSSLSNATAFSFVFAGMWMFGDATSVEILAYCLNAGFLSLIGVIFVVAVSQTNKAGVDKRTLKGVFTALSLAVGLSWEKTFDNAMDGLDDLSWFKGEDDKVKTIKLLFTLGIVLLTFPAWMVYILPKDNDEVKEACKTALNRGSLPCRAVCCDADIYDEEEPSTEAYVPATTVQTMAAPAPVMQSVQYVSMPSTQQQYVYQSVPGDARNVQLLQSTDVN